MDKIVLASRNAGKIREMKDMTAPLGIEILSAEDIEIPEVEETGTTFAENSLLKSQALASVLQLPCIADDSGLCVDVLDGAPGIYSARYAPDRNFDKGMDKLLNEIAATGMQNRSAHFSCVISLAFPDGRYELFEGRVDGKIADHKMYGENGFGYDAVFIPDGWECSFAQMSKEQKNKISHRGRAMQKLKAYLQSHGE